MTTDFRIEPRSLEWDMQRGLSIAADTPDGRAVFTLPRELCEAESGLRSGFLGWAHANIGRIEEICRNLYVKKHGQG